MQLNYFSLSSLQMLAKKWYIYHQIENFPAMKYLTAPKAIAAWNAIQPLSDRDRERLNRKFTVDFNFNSNHIEGNTLTYGQTELLLLFGKVVGEAEMKDLEEMKASDVGLKMMQEQAGIKDMPLTQNFILQLHKTLLREDYTVYRELPGGQQTSYVIHAGRYKTRPNSVITRYGDRFEYAAPEETAALMADLVDWYNKEESKGKLSPIELAALFHYRYIRIHPFENGNGRIARLIVNYILARHDYPMIVIRSRDKKKYMEALHQADLEVGSTPSIGAHADLNHIRPFLRYFIAVVAEEIYNDVRFLTEPDENVWWYDGQRVEFRTLNYAKILRIMQSQPSVTINSLCEQLSINKSAVQRLLTSLKEKGYIEAKNDEGIWRVIITPSV